MLYIVYPRNSSYGTYGANGSCHIVIFDLMVSPYGSSQNPSHIDFIIHKIQTFECICTVVCPILDVRFIADWYGPNSRKSTVVCNEYNLMTGNS